MEKHLVDPMITMRGDIIRFKRIVGHRLNSPDEYVTMATGEFLGKILALPLESGFKGCYVVTLTGIESVDYLDHFAGLYPNSSPLLVDAASVIR